MSYENTNTGAGSKLPLEGDVIYGPKRIEEASFKVRAYLDASLIDFSASVITFMPHTDPNTGQQTTQIQAGIEKIIRLTIKDIYGNEFTSGHGIVFKMDFIPSNGPSVAFISQFNNDVGRYEFVINSHITP